MKRKPLLLALFAVGTATPAFGQYTLTTLASFDGHVGGVNGNLVLSSDGTTLYGTTEAGGTYVDGMVFSVPIAGGNIATVVSFDGTNGNDPMAPLVLSGNTLYGTTEMGGAYNGGTVFSMSASGTITTLASLNGSIGSDPYGSLIVSGNNLYGTTYYGVGGGTVFSLPLTGGTPTALAAITGMHPGANLILSGSTLYGTAWSNAYPRTIIVFSVPITGGTPTTLASLSNPICVPYLLLSGSTLYGTRPGVAPGGVSTLGGPSGPGTLFSLPVTGGTPNTLATFDGDNGNAYSPCTGLFLAGNTLYGATTGDGAYDDGTLYSLPVTGGMPTVLYSFTGGTDGCNPVTSVISDASAPSLIN